jgi:cytochrome b6-f complex iron-sulfur subunit
MAGSSGGTRHPRTEHHETSADDQPDRRDFLSRVSSTAMVGGLVAGYGTAALMAGQFLYPTVDDSVGWRFVARCDELKLGEALHFVTPSGAKVVIARQQEGESAKNFVALSSICPHLGCQVHWEAHNDRFFCPCHNGVFDRSGQPLEGPPKQANQNLTRFPLMVENGLLFIEAPLRALGRALAQHGEHANPPVQQV